MAGAMKAYKKESLGRTFPNSFYNDPRGGQASSLERNILRYRAAETALYLHVAQEVRDFMLQTIHPHAAKTTPTPLPMKSEEQRLKGVLRSLILDAELAGKVTADDARTLRNQVSRDPKEGKKLRRAFACAVEQGMFTQDEADELQDLLGYRNDIAHRIHEIMADITRDQWSLEMLEFRPPAYKSDAFDRLQAFYLSLSARAKSVTFVLDLSLLSFDHAEKVYKEELRRLEKVISRQIARENQRMRQIRAECDLAGTELQGELHPRHYLNHYHNGYDGAPNTGHLTKRGAEICYRLFDMGKSPIAVAYLMGIGLQSANRRKKRWQEAGGAKRIKSFLQTGE